MRWLVLPLALIALPAPLGAQTIPPHVQEIARILQTGGLLPGDLSPDERFDVPASRADLLLRVAEHVRPTTGGRQPAPGWIFYEGSEPPDTLRAFLDDLRTSGVVSARTFERLRGLMAREEQALTLRFATAQAAARLTATEDLFQPTPLAATLNAFVARGVLTGPERVALDERLDRDEIESPAEFVAALPSGVFVPDVAPGDVAESFFQRALQRVLGTLRQRQIADIALGTVSTHVTASPDVRNARLTWHHIRVQAEMNGHPYKMESMLGLGVDAETFSLSSTHTEEVAPLINKALRDLDAAHRVYTFRSDGRQRAWERPNGVSFLALTASEAKALGRGPLDLLYDSAILHDDTLSTACTEAMLGLLRDVGMNGSPEGQDALDHSYAASPEALLESLGLLLYIDGEMGDLDTPYVSLLGDLAALSHGLFAPEAVDGTFDWEARTASVAFTLGDTRYEADLEFNGDWMDGAALQLVDRALREASGAKLYTVIYGRFDDGRPMAGDRYLILTEAQRALVEREGWLEILPYTEWATAPAFPAED